MEYLSNTMPELTDHELKCKGSYTISYFDIKVNSYVSAKYCSLYMFTHLTGLDDTTKNRDLICSKLAYRNYFSLTDKFNPSKFVTIYS